MPIKQSIESDLKTALLSGEKDTATVLRGLKSTILNAEIAQGKRQEGLSDEEVTTLLAKEVKSRVESAQMYEQGGSPDRAAKEMSEKSLIERYLPSQLDDSELESVIQQAIQATNSTSMADMGKVIGTVKTQVKGQADGARIAGMVKRLLG